MKPILIKALPTRVSKWTINVYRMPKLSSRKSFFNLSSTTVIDKSERGRELLLALFSSQLGIFSGAGGSNLAGEGIAGGNVCRHGGYRQGDGKGWGLVFHAGNE